MTESQKLLLEYAESGSETAFRELVHRYIDFVYSAAVRLTDGNSELAKDVAQSVFVRLAHKAGRLPKNVLLGGWLHRDTCFVAATTMRGERRRQSRERQAVQMQTQVDHTEANLARLAPVLDEAINELDVEDRAAIVLRFFEQCELRLVGEALGITENSARMRVTRALEKLRLILGRRGVTLAPVALAGILTGQVVKAAPTGLAAGISGKALASLAAKGSLAMVFKFLTLGKVKVSLAGLVAVTALALWLNHGDQSAVSLQNVNRTRITGSRQEGAVQAAVDASNGASAAEKGSVTNAKKKKKQSNVPQMQLQLVDSETGEPLANAKVNLAYFRDGGQGKGVHLLTDSSGKVMVDEPQKPYRSYNLFVTADGHVPETMMWKGRSGETYPEDYQMKLEKGTTIGGTVFDEGQQPVAGAKIEFISPGVDMARKENVQFGPDTVTTTDFNGRWYCNMVPKDMEQMGLLVTHPQYATKQTGVPVNTSGATNSVITMKTGFTIAGEVQDQNGSPIAGVKLKELHNTFEPRASTETDASGGFEFKHMNPGELTIVLQAKGFAAVAKTLEFSNSVTGLKYQMGPGQRFRGRVLDEQGEPVTNAVVQTDSDNQGLRKFEWSTRTDKEGRFEWDSAPEEPVLYWFEASGFGWIRSKEIKADGSDHEIILQRSLQRDQTVTAESQPIAGTATDADTGVPLDRFEVLWADFRGPQSPGEYRFVADGKDGKFTVRPDGLEGLRPFQIQIRKEGYLPVCSTNIMAKELTGPLEFKLRKGSGPAGIVLLLSGEPARDATVFLYERQGGVYMDKPGKYRKELHRETAHVQTDESGHFAFAPKLEPRGLIAIHAEGYADMSIKAFEQKYEMILEPWGRVEGRLIIDGRPAQNKNIMLDNFIRHYNGGDRLFPPLSLSLETITDEAGRFVFEKVPAGQRRVYWRLKIGLGPILDSHGETVVVAAGTTTQVELGGTGRPIIGRAVLPGNNANLKGIAVGLELKLVEHPENQPKRESFASYTEWLDALKKYNEVEQSFWTSERGRELERIRRTYRGLCEVDGTFRIPDIPAGEYELKIEVRDKQSPNRFPDQGREIGSLVRQITVPEMEGGRSDEALDLGRLELVRKAGERASGP